jgi:hypothetical protein
MSVVPNLYDEIIANSKVRAEKEEFNFWTYMAERLRYIV